MDKNQLVIIAREAIKSGLTGSRIDRSAWETQELQKDGACFVTLTIHGQLRGCIGSLTAHRPLIDDLIHNARAAAFEDPRFPPLSAGEFEQIKVEVSLLSAPEPLEYHDMDNLREQIVPGEHGVLLKEGWHQATFLPQVWDQLPSFDLFFTHLCLKAGLDSTCLKSHPEIQTYRVEKIEE